MSEARERPRRARRETITTLFTDEDLHAIAKPVGLATVSERWDPDAPTVIDELWKLWRADDPAAPRPHVIHRLDKETSGVLLFARHREAQREVRRQFRERSVSKSYLALVAGKPLAESGRIELRVERDPRRPGLMRAVTSGGKECVTDYETVEEFRGTALLRLLPVTGRTHQVRISLQSIGHPCAVDPAYGGAEALYLSSFKRGYKAGKGRAETPLIARVSLHAESLRLTHPRTCEPIIIEAPLPHDLETTLRQLRRWAS